MTVVSGRFSLRRYGVLSTPPDDEVLAPDDVAVPVVDGVPLFERLGDRFPGVDIDLVAPPSRHWLGSPEYVEHARAVVLDGECGDAGCCGVVARIVLGPDVVVWRDLYTHGAPDLTPGVRFEFDRSGYERAIWGVRQLEPTPWSFENHS